MRSNNTLVHNGRRQRVISRIGVKLSAELAQAKNLDRFGHRLGANGRPLPAKGPDPRYPQTVEVLGWIEPSRVDPDWTIKIRVNEAGPVELEVASPSGKARRSLFQGDLEVGEHELHWDGLDATGNVVRGRNNLVLRTDKAVRTFWLTGRGVGLRDLSDREATEGPDVGRVGPSKPRADRPRRRF